MVAYKSKVVQFEYNTLNFSPRRHIINEYPMEDNNGSDNSSNFLTDDRHLSETVISDNIYQSISNSPEMIDSVL